MKMNIFAKTVKTGDGRSFVRYIGKLEKSTGEKTTVTVKFTECDPPSKADCPMEIDIPKSHAQLSQKHVTSEVTGDTATYWTLWAKQWTRTGDYIDHSLDEYND